MRDIFEMGGVLGHRPSFRRWELEDGILYFCEGPDHTTFNISIRNDGSLRIWQFLPVELTGRKERLRVERAFDSGRIGLEITQENIFSLYLERNLDGVPEDQTEPFLQQNVSGYLSLRSPFPAVEFTP